MYRYSLVDGRKKQISGFDVGILSFQRKREVIAMFSVFLTEMDFCNILFPFVATLKAKGKMQSSIPCLPQIAYAFHYFEFSPLRT
jgi:hypothetical protein